MPATTNMTLRVALTGQWRADVDADGAVVTVKLLDANGAPTGGDLVLKAPATTNPAMTQYAPGKFKFTTDAAPFTRGSRYRATYVITVGGVAQPAQTQDVTAYSQDLHPRPTSFHTWTTLQMRNIVRRALGIREKTATQEGQEPGSYNSLEIVNNGLEWLWREHRFTFQLAEPWYFDLIAGQERVALPDDYMEIESLERRGLVLGNFCRADLAWVQRMRQKAITAPVWDVHYDIVTDPPHEGTGLVTYALELWPTPTAFIESAGALVYYRQYPKVTQDSELIPFPAGFHSVAALAVTMEAFESEGDKESAAEARGKFEAKLAKAIRHTARAGPQDLGSMIRGKSSIQEERPHDPYSAVDVD